MARVLDRASVVTHTGLRNPSLASGDSRVGVATSYRFPCFASTKCLSGCIEDSLRALRLDHYTSPDDSHYLHPMETPVNDHTGQ